MFVKRSLLIFRVVSRISACVADAQLAGNDGGVDSSSFPVVFGGESKQVRTPGPAHPCMVVPSEVRDMSTTTTTVDECFMFPPVAVYCHPPSPTGSPSRRHAQRQSSSESPCVDEQSAAAAPAAKRPVCARLSVPTEGPQRPRRRATDASLSRSNSHPLHRHRRRSRPGACDVDAGHHRQTEPLVERAVVLAPDQS